MMKGEILVGIYQYDNSNGNYIILGKGIFSHKVILTDFKIKNTKRTKCVWTLSIEDITKENIEVEEVFNIENITSLDVQLKNNKYLSCVAINELMEIFHLLSEYDIGLLNL